MCECDSPNTTPRIRIVRVEEVVRAIAVGVFRAFIDIQHPVPIRILVEVVGHAVPIDVGDAFFQGVDAVPIIVRVAEIEDAVGSGTAAVPRTWPSVSRI